ncbi:hypothetical protein LSH36_1496g00004 [Paralvinella palmiformis]|uniref:Uncharacterized protein n=1 Tax=Paralvinella palmiformis TaxID=53620 RepID=A0AAD9MR76_9ANNE|nr:hypothetical protein LSH36_1496g00004 [Paralvinella palmiformis]
MKGVIHLAAASIINALWDLWARIEGKDPEKLVSTIDFTYIEDSLTKQEAIEAEILKNGFTAYTTSAGWLGYDDDKIRKAPDMQNSYHPVLHIDPDMSQHIIIIKHASKLGFCLTYLSQQVASKVCNVNSDSYIISNDLAVLVVNST